jgi:hypothetical protein
MNAASSLELIAAIDDNIIAGQVTAASLGNSGKISEDNIGLIYCDAEMLCVRVGVLTSAVIWPCQVILATNGCWSSAPVECWGVP